MSPTVPAYDAIGRSYQATREPDPRLAAVVHSALEGAASVLNVGAGTGSYEPRDREVIAVEPSSVMISQRPPGSAPVIQASAEDLPLDDDSVGVAMAILSDHHWRDRPAGLREMARVARRRLVLLNFDPALAGDFWLTREYLPGFLDLVPEPYLSTGYFEEELRSLLGPMELTAVPVPHDCTDGFYYAYWRRPDAYLDAQVRENISVFHLLAAAEVSGAVDRLRADLEGGRWDERHRELATRTELDLGLRLVVVELS